MNNKKQARSSLVDLVKNIPPPTPPLTKDNATTTYAVKALTEAQNGNLRKLVRLADVDWDDESEDSRKALALFEEAAFSREPHWLAESVQKLIADATVENTLMLIDVLKVYPAFYIKAASTIVKLASDHYGKQLETLRIGWQRGSAKTNQPYRVLREFFITNAIPLAEQDKTCRYHDLIIGCKGLLDMKCRELNLPVPHEKVLRKWLKEAADQGRLPISPTASNPGRPAK